MAQQNKIEVDDWLKTIQTQLLSKYNEYIVNSFIQFIQNETYQDIQTIKDDINHPHHNFIADYVQNTIFNETNNNNPETKKFIKVLKAIVNDTNNDNIGHQHNLQSSSPRVQRRQSRHRSHRHYDQLPNPDNNKITKTKYNKEDMVDQDEMMDGLFDDENKENGSLCSSVNSQRYIDIDGDVSSLINQLPISWTDNNNNNNNNKQKDPVWRGISMAYPPFNNPLSSSSSLHNAVNIYSNTKSCKAYDGDDYDADDDDHDDDTDHDNSHDNTTKNDDALDIISSEDEEDDMFLIQSMDIIKKCMYLKRLSSILREEIADYDNSDFVKNRCGIMVEYGTNNNGSNNNHGQHNNNDKNNSNNQQQDENKRTNNNDDNGDSNNNEGSDNHDDGSGSGSGGNNNNNNNDNNNDDGNDGDENKKNNTEESKGEEDDDNEEQEDEVDEDAVDELDLIDMADTLDKMQSFQDDEKKEEDQMELIDDKVFQILNDINNYTDDEIFATLNDSLTPQTLPRLTKEIDKLTTEVGRLYHIFINQKKKPKLTQNMKQNSNNNNNNKRNKRKKAKQRKNVYELCNLQHIKSHCKISKQFTFRMIPSRIREKISDVYIYIIQFISINYNGYYETDQYKVFDFNFHNKDNDQSLYCIGIKTGSLKYEIMDSLFTNNDLSMRFNIYLNEYEITKQQKTASYANKIKQVTQKLNQVKSKIIRDTQSTKWCKIPIYNQGNIRNNRRKMTLSLTLDEFIDQCLDHIQTDEKNNDKDVLIPIIMYDNNNSKKPSSCIEYLWIVTIEKCIDIGISIKYSDKTNNKFIVTGIHLNKEFLLYRHSLVSIKPCNLCKRCDCFDKFTSNITDLSIGNVDDEQNKIKDLQKRLKIEKEENIKNMRENIDIKQKMTELEQENINLRAQLELENKSTIHSKESTTSTIFSIDQSLTCAVLSDSCNVENNSNNNSKIHNYPTPKYHSPHQSSLSSLKTATTTITTISSRHAPHSSSVSSKGSYKSTTSSNYNNINVHHLDK